MTIQFGRYREAREYLDSLPCRFLCWIGYDGSCAGKRWYVDGPLKVMQHFPKELTDGDDDKRLAQHRADSEGSRSQAATSHKPLPYRGTKASNGERGIPHRR